MSDTKLNTETSTPIKPPSNTVNAVNTSIIPIDYNGKRHYQNDILKDMDKKMFDSLVEQGLSIVLEGKNG